jgi:hypothetical protein
MRRGFHEEQTMRNDDRLQVIELDEAELSKVSAGKSDMFLNLDGIKGESTDSGHKDTIEILSFSGK